MDTARLKSARVRRNEADAPGGHAAGVTMSFSSIYRFGRFSALSFSLMVPLLGAAVVSRDISTSLLAGVAAVAVAFHLFAYISNDVIDLTLDRTEPLRADSPLVRGLVQPSAALTIALLQVPIAFGIHVMLAGGAAASVSLAAAMALMLLYNVYGKRCRFPPLSDAVQSLGWVALMLYGALVARAPLNQSLLALAALIFVYVLLINGVHGGLRDLRNDQLCGARTTAIYFGSNADASGGVILPRSIVIYGLMLQILMLVISLVVVVTNWSDYGSTPAALTTAALVVTQLVLLALLWMTLTAARRRSAMIRAGILHLFVSLASIIIPFAWLMDAVAVVVVVASYVLPVLTMCLHDGLTWE